jgi:hydrogenase nickel incorporation protein HypB
LLEQTIKEVGRTSGLSIGVIEGDVATRRDAERIGALGVPVIQINTAGGCHLDANMLDSVLDELPLGEIDILFIENVGNLVCPAGFDLGEHATVTVLSVTEGDDKPTKYPAAFLKSACTVITKTDLLAQTNFDMDVAIADLKAINSSLELFRVSNTTGEGIEAWVQWLLAKREAGREQDGGDER